MFASAIAGIVGLILAVVMLAVASHHTDANSELIRALADSTAPGFLLAPAGFGAMLIAAGMLTLRTAAFPRWTGVVALIGGVFMLLTFLTLLGKEGDNVFGIGYPLGFLSLAIWSFATSLSSVRRLSPSTVAARNGP